MSREDRFPIYTVGHSTRTISQFVEMLRAAQVTELVDVRSIPRSRTNPQYNLDALPMALAEYQINHTYIEELGGRRPRQWSIDPELNSFWQNQSFHNYADHALSSDFHAGFRQLLELSQRKTCAIMCSEAVWWRCHRRIVADYLLDGGREVFHLMGNGRIEPAKVTSAATRQGGQLIYPGAGSAA
ncbi:DUF488 domain-containing protein [Sphingobium aromaticiconvertens]|uniref:DUF488 domain-containing protein n=1 Tax=Sphingobium aromaticiconvertens TaxID=365341 RepID=UPI0030167B62